MSSKKRNRENGNKTDESEAKKQKTDLPTTTSTTGGVKSTKKAPNDSITPTTTQSFFSKFKMYILKAGIEKARLKIFETQVEKYGGEISYSLSDDLTHIIVEDKIDLEKLCRLLKLDKPPINIPIIKSTWLSTCFREKQFTDIKDFTLDVQQYKDEK
ncbi:hypothetical protein SNE40_007952 [Patella caerulea]|uniref:BRCT domain-containing protein n=1 Tax=Patella caerulea TaxID=87958 RepID=A0AAN8PUG0_PATCE